MANMRDYISSIMRDKRGGFAAGIVKAFLKVASVFYFALVTIHRFLYKNRILKVRKAPCKVISVGNITLGGTGKTPFTSMLAAFLKEKGKKAVILIRGYGEDEWKMLKSVLADVPVLVGRDRVKNARIATNEYHAEAILLDDGFQHRRIFRDVNILLIDSTDPFGNGNIFPRGIMREPMSRIKDADLVVLSKADKGKDGLRKLYGDLSAFKSESEILEGFHRPLYFIDVKEGVKKDLSIVKGKSVCVISSIADPSYFSYTVKNLGAIIALEFIYPDHYNYRKKDIENIVEKCEGSKIERIVTTEKDIPKLGLLLPTRYSSLLALHIEFEITKGKNILLERCL